MNGRRAGFTLVELVVAIGIVVLLAGLTLSVAVKVIEASEARETETTLRLLDQAVKQWEVTADRKVTWWDEEYDQQGPPDWRDRADLHSSTPPVLIITELLSVIGRSTEVLSVLAQIDPAVVARYTADSYPDWIQTMEEKESMDEFDGSITILDAWGTPIYATHPGRADDPIVFPHEPPGYPPAVDPDGTIRTYNERDYGIAPNRQIVFVSAGPDRRFGHSAEFMHLQGMALHEAIKEARRDNLYTASVSYN